MTVVEELAARLAALERRLAGMMRYGAVAEVDPAAQTVRLDLGGGALSAPIRYAQPAGALKAHAPPSVGQQMIAMSPAGDMRQALAMNASWSEANASPGASAEANVLTFGEAAISLAGDALVIAIGGASVTISGEGLAVEGGQVTHNGTNIGDSHVHTGVTRGGAPTNGPS